MNKEQIKEVLVKFIKLNENKLDKDYDEELHPEDIPGRLGDFLYEVLSNSYRGETVQSDWEIEEKEQHGGEGQGDDWWYVVSLTDKKNQDAVFIQFNGWYASNYGHELIDPAEFDIVESKPVVVKKWFVKE